MTSVQRANPSLATPACWARPGPPGGAARASRLRGAAAIRRSAVFTEQPATENYQGEVGDKELKSTRIRKLRSKRMQMKSNCSLGECGPERAQIFCVSTPRALW
ncbi:uncharacterized protein [Macaca nemestrina]|uniref:uncharacterized protein isoform X2 n=1 Tax=Macaca nemestrina TaxID=9545 RepID=UPI0039B926C7